jgi:hypothetical protein
MTVRGPLFVRTSAETGRPEDLLSARDERTMKATTKAAPRRANVRGHGTEAVAPMQQDRTSRRCDQTTVSGYQCKRRAAVVARERDGSTERYCTQHANYYGLHRRALLIHLVHPKASR